MYNRVLDFILQKKLFCVRIIITSVIILIISITLVSSNNDESSIRTYLDTSVPQVGVTEQVRVQNDGSGIIVAVIDTGVDYTHPDLIGFGKDGKVIGGFDFVDNDNDPMDTNGHGTGVAGIIAADGILKGVAPKVKIIAYRVSSDGESVSSELIEKAIQKAIEENVDIINISLGVNQTNNKIDEAVRQAVKKGIVVITAAGNDGPNEFTIGSPGKTSESITVGATYNNLSSSIVATLQIADKEFQLLPMKDAPISAGSINERVVYAEYSKVINYKGITANNSIILAKRGSDIDGEKIFFSVKEKNAADAGASAIIVYNNDSGIYLGELVHELNKEDYTPHIPAFSMDGDDGIEVRELLNSFDSAELNIIYDSDYVVYFSSRGPVSEFYIKPDLVAPGVFINTTSINNEYAILSGTSFAAPHVTGAAALLLEKNPNQNPAQIKTILTTSADPLVGILRINSHEAFGSGRLNVTSALNSDVNSTMSQIVFHLSNKKLSQSVVLDIEPDSIDIKINDSIKLEYSDKSNSITAKSKKDNFGKFYGVITIHQKDSTYRIPVLVHMNRGTIITEYENNTLNISLAYNGYWSYAKISIFDGIQTHTRSITPEKGTSITTTTTGNYQISAKILESERVVGDAFDVLNIQQVGNQYDINIIPPRTLFIIIAFMSIVTIIIIRTIKTDRQQ